MRDILGALFLLAILIVVLTVVARYTYLAWFAAEEFRQVVQHNWPAWQRRLRIGTNALKWMNSPSYMLAARLTSLAALLFCIILLVVLAKPIALGFIDAFP